MAHEENKSTENVENPTAETTENTAQSVENPSSDEPQAKVEDAPSADNSDLAKLRAEAQDFKDKYLRLYAEFDNFRKRTAKERMEIELQANRKLLTALVSVIDDFDRAQVSIEKADDKGQAALEGIEIIYKRFIDTLKQNGLKAMESAIGQTFDAELQEGIAMVPVTEEDKKGKIIDEVEKGYYLNDKVLRFAKVVIGS
jgi:molecular chaperone GrpE